MKCLNCPNDETFFKRDGVTDSHLCGICGAFISNEIADENLQQLLIKEHTDSQSCNPKTEIIINEPDAFPTENDSCFANSLRPSTSQEVEALKDNILTTLSDTHVSDTNENKINIFASSDLHPDYKLLQEKHAALWDDFRGLESTLEELMVAYEAQIEVTQKLQSDHRASDELRELEASRLRMSFREEKNRVEALESENSKLSSLCTKLKAELEMLRSENEHIRADCFEVEEKFNQLKQQAERKLKLAEERVKVTISSYTSLQEKFSSLESEFSSLSSIHESCSAELCEKESRFTELNQNLASLLEVIKEKEQEICGSETIIANNQLELQHCKQKLHDMQELNCRFKAGLVRANEDNRALKEKLSRLELVENENHENRSRLDSLMNENSNLKSRIFDAMETEKALRQALSCPNYAQSEDSSILDELESLKKDLQEKTIENKELLQISKELLDKLECTASSVLHPNIDEDRDF